MRGRHSPAERIRQRRIDPARFRQSVERRILAETEHLDGPFHRRSAAVQYQPSICLARDRQDAAIDFGCERPIDLEFRLAGRFALVERRIVEKREADGAFDFQCAAAGEEHRGCVCIDALDRRAVMGCGISKQSEHRLLGMGCVGHPPPIEWARHRVIRMPQGVASVRQSVGRYCNARQ
jgi:hypothetical protein